MTLTPIAIAALLLLLLIAAAHHRRHRPGTPIQPRDWRCPVCGERTPTEPDIDIHTNYCLNRRTR